MEITRIGVVGAGQMGAGIAQVAAACGLEVMLNDVSEELIQRGIAGIGKRLDKAVSKGKLDEATAESTKVRIFPALGLESLAKTQFIIEAATEREAIKIDIFSKLNAVAPPEVIFASNTSSISITRMGAVTGRPERFIGMHFMNPVPVMKLVEIISGLATSTDTIDATVALAERMGKTCTRSRDFPGFIVNRILMPMINEAVFALHEGVGSPEDIDNGMKLGTNQPMGPLALADLIGLDTCLAIMEVLYKGFADSKYRPCPLLRQYVDAGWLGRKSGRGFYDYRD
ncbi:MAG: 3-hydroxybutyryl-CoA dehydrogenase [Deltaproteobacteria bacterium]|nr:MAG: 3-hydroxybutyryl-CoA dehydrogenase [Deltaproteobacteria bacterium]